MKVGDRISFTEDNQSGTGVVRRVVPEDAQSMLVEVDGAPTWGHRGRDIDTPRDDRRYWWVTPTNAKLIEAAKPEGQKDAIKVGDRVSFDDGEKCARGTVAAKDSNAFVIALDPGYEGWTATLRLDLKLPADGNYWRVDLKDLKLIASEGQKDDSAKLRMDLIPAKSLRLILEHVWDHNASEDDVVRAPDASLTGCLHALVEWRVTGEIAWLAKAASDAIGLCGGELDWTLTGEGLEEVARVLKYGAHDAPRPDGTKGYGENNWQLVPNAENRYYAAALRHWSKAQKGEERDVDSGHKHVGHLACCLLFLLYVCG